MPTTRMLSAILLFVSSASAWGQAVEVRTDNATPGSGIVRLSFNSGVADSAATATFQNVRVTFTSTGYFRVPTAAVDPTGVDDGDLYFDTAGNVLKVATAPNTWQTGTAQTFAANQTIKVNVAATNGSDYGFTVAVRMVQEAVDGTFGEGTPVATWDPAWSTGWQTITLSTTFNVTSGTTYEIEFVTNSVQSNATDQYLSFYTDNSPTATKMYVQDISTPVAFSDYGNVTVETVAGRLVVSDGSTPDAYCDGNTWTNACSREAKEGIRPFGEKDYDQAATWLRSTEVVWYRYKGSSDPRPRVGLIAEDVPDVLADRERKGISTADAIGVLFAIVKDQQRELEDLRKLVLLRPRDGPK